MTISEVSKLYDISADTLRYYERIGLIPTVPRTKSGNRDYDEESCSWIELAKCMRSSGVTIEALIEYCALTQEGDATISARKDLLMDEREKVKMKMDEMQKTLERLNYKISKYAEAEKTGVLDWEE
ncbi:MAG: MerR family transcriptional regulator [Eubacteriaceae bacterium]|jgi:DNA-binding transcriptional MerR regulator